MTIELPEDALERIRDVLRRHPAVVKAAVFGSRAMGRARPASDVDVAVWGVGDEMELARIRGALDELPLPWVIDVVSVEGVGHAALREHIERVGITFLG